jgi:hypothetical protein
VECDEEKMMQFKGGGGGVCVCWVSFPFVSPPASEEANLLSVTNSHFFPLDAPNSVECGGPGFNWKRQTQQKPL